MLHLPLLHVPLHPNMSRLLSSLRPSSQSHVLDLVRKYDYENYLATLLIKRPKLRRTAFALRALNVELAQVLDVTSNPTTASGRFAFWFDVIEQLFSKEKAGRYDGNPVVRELRSTFEVNNHSSSKRHFMNLVTSRASPKNLSSHPFETVSEIESYSEHSIGSVYFLLVECLVAEAPEFQRMHLQLDHVASHVSKCLGLVNVMRGLVHNAKRSRCYIPNDLLLKHGASHEDFLRCSARKEVSDVCYDLACAAKGHMDKTYTLIADLNHKSMVNLLLPITFAELYLDRMERANFNVFSHELGRKDTNLPFKFWWKSFIVKMKSKRIKK